MHVLLGSVLPVAGVLVEPDVRLAIAVIGFLLLRMQSLKVVVDFDVEVLLIAVLLILTALTILAASLTFAWLIDKTNLALRCLAAEAVLAAVDAAEDGAPLEVKKRNEHKREAEADGDVERPVDLF